MWGVVLEDLPGEVNVYCEGVGVGKKQKGRFVENRPFAQLQDVLQGLDVLGLPALRALDYVELDALAFLKRTEAVALDGGVMHEDVVAILTADKSEALGIVKPFYCSLFHYSCSSYSNVPLNAMLVYLRVELYSRNKQEDQSDSTTKLSIPSERGWWETRA